MRLLNLMTGAFIAFVILAIGWGIYLEVRGRAATTPKISAGVVHVSSVFIDGHEYLLTYGSDGYPSGIVHSASCKGGD